MAAPVTDPEGVDILDVTVPLLLRRRPDLETPARIDPAISTRLDRFDDRQRLARRLASHMAAGPPVDPDPDHTPRHFRRTDA